MDAGLSPVRELYPCEVDLREPRADSNHLMELQDGGFIGFTGPGSGSKPVYIDPSLERPAMNLMSRLNQWLYDKWNIALPYGYLKIRKGRLPCIIYKDSEGRPVAWKKVLGEYDPVTMEIIIDENLEHGEVMHTLGHELVHYVQHVTGGLGRYLKKYGKRAVDYIERGAEYFNDGYLRGKYPTNNRKLEKALTGA